MLTVLLAVQFAQARTFAGTEVPYPDPLAIGTCMRPVATAIGPGPTVGGICYEWREGPPGAFFDYAKAWLWTPSGGFVLLTFDSADTLEQTSIKDIDENGVALGMHQFNFYGENFNRYESFTWDGSVASPQARAPGVEVTQTTVVPLFIRGGRIVSNDGGLVTHAPGAVPQPLNAPWFQMLAPVDIHLDGSFIGYGVPAVDSVASYGWVYDTAPTMIPVLPGVGHIVSNVLLAGPNGEVFGFSWAVPGAYTYWRYQQGTHTVVDDPNGALHTAVAYLPDGAILFDSGRIHTEASGFEDPIFVGSGTWHTPVDVGPSGLIVHSGVTTAEPAFWYFEEVDTVLVDVDVELTELIDWPNGAEIALELAVSNDGPDDTSPLPVIVLPPDNTTFVDEVGLGLGGNCEADPAVYAVNCSFSAVLAGAPPVVTTLRFVPDGEGPFPFSAEGFPAEAGSNPPDLTDEITVVRDFDTADLAFIEARALWGINDRTWRHFPKLEVNLVNNGPDAAVARVDASFFADETSPNRGSIEMVDCVDEPCLVDLAPMESTWLSIKYRGVGLEGDIVDTKPGRFRILLTPVSSTVDPDLANNEVFVDYEAQRINLVPHPEKSTCATASGPSGRGVLLLPLLVLLLRRRRYGYGRRVVDRRLDHGRPPGRPETGAHSQ